MFLSLCSNSIALLRVNIKTILYFYFKKKRTEMMKINRYILLTILFTFVALWLKPADSYAGGVVINSSQTLNVDSKTLKVPTGDITNNGTLKQSTGTIEIGGNWTNNNSFTSGTGEVKFTGSTGQTIKGDNTFDKFTSTTPNNQLNFESGKTQTITSTLTLTGASGSLLKLRSTSAGTQWKIDPQGTRNISFVDVQDSNNTNIAVIGPTSSTDNGNNTNWFITETTATPTPISSTVPTATPIPTASTFPTSTPDATPTPPGEEEIKAAFDAEPTLGILPLNVKFTDKSTGDINSWLWDFGDGGESEEQNPTHTYQNAGIFTVTLIVSGFDGQDTLTERNLIDVRSSEGVVADFGADPTVGNVPLKVKFTDKSLNEPTSWVWDFGNGGESDEQNPTHTYQSAGIFTVSLTATNSDSTDTIEKQNLINVSQEDVVAEFKAEPTVGFAPLTVKFTDLSEPVDSIITWLWEFGDGGNDTNQNPEHEYQTEGFYTVKLTVGNESGENHVKVDTNLIIVKSQGVPIAEFKATPTVGLVDFDVKFSDLSEPEGNIASWIWDFGDGGISTEQNPTHTYKTEGIRTVKLTVSNSNGADTETKINLIGARDSSAPIAEFSATPTAGQLPVKVTFTDNSASDGIASWLWDFGDGATSTDQNPTHTYTKPGTFNVKLTVSSPSGTGEENKTNLVRVVDAGEVIAEFAANPVLGNEIPFEVQFLDNSVGEITSWAWDFGDGMKSTEQNPVHSYANIGEFSVKLKVNATNSEDSLEKDDFINVLENEATPTPGAQLTVSPDSLPRSSAPIAVEVTASDVNGKPIEGVVITANAQGRKASVSPPSVTTDSNGDAKFDVQFVTFRKISSVTFTAEGVNVQLVQK